MLLQDRLFDKSHEFEIEVGLPITPLPEVEVPLLQLRVESESQLPLVVENDHHELVVTPALCKDM